MSLLRFKTTLLAACTGLAALIPPSWALSTREIVTFEPSAESLALVAEGRALPIRLDENVDSGILRAAGDFQADVERVTGVRPSLTSGGQPAQAEIMIVGQVGKSPLLERLATEGQVDLAPLDGAWEAFLIETVEHPLPGVDRALVVAGSDKRGTIYGLYELSEQIGVSPWYWWADVPPAHRESIHVKPDRVLDPGPAVRYRGIFLNDEAPALTGWAQEKFGGLNHRFYAHVFELILRLKGNYLWPAMWNNAFNDDDPLNPETASEYGIVMGTSHHEPMIRAHQEWARYGEGEWNYATNPAKLREFWKEGIIRGRDHENIITLAMRGDGDVAMGEDTNIALLEEIVADQRGIIAEHMDADPEEIPQVWALYKEVQDYYEQGMRVPDDVILLWADDNWGNLRRLPTDEERERAGGAGIYYHFDYVGGPRSYKWLNTSPLPRVWEQLHLAWKYDATEVWIVNVGDLKPMEFPIEFFLTYAWDPESWPYERLDDFHRLWAEREFGSEHATEIADLVAGYTKFNGRRKPELLSPETFSLLHFNEAERVIGDWKNLVERAESLARELPDEHQDAFFQLVLYPIKASAVVNELYVAAARNRLYAVQGRASTNDYDQSTRDLFEKDAALAREYHSINNGKWNHFMAQNNIGYTYWQQPPRDAMPAVSRVHVPAGSEIGVSIEGSPRAWPTHDVNKSGNVLPPLTVYGKETRWIDVFNRSQESFAFTARASEPWIQISPSSGTISRDTRLTVSVDWDAVPLGEHEATITVTGAHSRVPIVVPVLNPESPRPEAISGFVETDGYVSIEAPHFQRAVERDGITWKTLPDFGRTLGAVTMFPVTAEPLEPGGDSPHLEYDLHLFSEGEIELILHLSPTLDFQPGPGLRYAVSFDDGEPEIFNVDTMKDGTTWNQAVADNIRRSITRHRIDSPGPHTLKFWMVSPGVVLQKIVINTRPGPRDTDAGQGERRSYLGPTESPYFESH